MKRYLLILFCASTFCTSLRAQEATSVDDFLNLILRNESTYFQFQKEGDGLYRGKVLEKYFEVLEFEETWFFYEHSHVKEFISYHRICQVDMEEAQNKIRNRIGVDDTESASNPTVFLSEILTASENCLTSNWVEELNYKPVLEQALTGERMLPKINGLDTLKSIDSQAQILRSEDGRLVLDVKMELPDSLELVHNLGVQLHYLRSEKQYYYPSPDIPEWKANLVRNGFMTNEILNVEPDAEEREQAAYRYINIDTNKQTINFQVLIPVKKMALHNEQLEANGQVNIYVTNNQLSSAQQVLSDIRPGERYHFNLDEKGTVDIEELGLWFHHKTNPWRSLEVYEVGGDTLARFQRGEKPHIESFLAEKGKTYAIHIEGLERRLVKIPFRFRLLAD